jgi:hypothetical protein
MQERELQIVAHFSNIIAVVSSPRQVPGAHQTDPAELPLTVQTTMKHNSPLRMNSRNPIIQISLNPTRNHVLYMCHTPSLFFTKLGPAWIKMQIGDSELWLIKDSDNEFPFDLEFF